LNVSMTDDVKFHFKVKIAGDYSVGKALLVERFTESTSDEMQGDIILRNRIFDTDSGKTWLGIYRCNVKHDYRIDERIFKSWRHLRSCGFVVVCDLTDRETFENSFLWCQEFVYEHKITTEGAPFMIVGNKYDLLEGALNVRNLFLLLTLAMDVSSSKSNAFSRVFCGSFARSHIAEYLCRDIHSTRGVSEDEGHEMCNELIMRFNVKAFYIETSAKTGKNIDAAFQKLTEIMIRNAKENPGNRKYNHAANVAVCKSEPRKKGCSIT